MLATVLFTDIVGSTAIAEELGDRRWRELLRRHHAIVRRELRRYRGREIDTAGDGFLALFDSPAQAVRCACAVSDAVRELGIEIRAGLHLGEVEVTGGKAQGIGVHIGARILAIGKPGDVLVSAPLRSTVAGSDLEFEPRGRRRLKGVEGTWQLFSLAAVDGAPRTTALEPEEAGRRRASIAALPIGRRPRIMALLLALAVVAVVAGVLIARPDTPPPRAGTGPPIGSLVLIDPDTNRTERVIPQVMRFPNVTGGHHKLGAGEGSVWVLSGVKLAAVHPTRGEVWKEIPIGRGLDNKDVEVGYRTIWVLVGEWLYRINPAPGDVLQQTTHAEVTGMVGFGGDLDIGSGGVWLGGRSSVLRLDPQSAQVIQRIDVPGTVDHIAAGMGSVWAIDSLDSKLFRIDPRKNRVLATIPVSGSMDEIAIGEGSVWILDSSLGTLSSIRPDTEEVREVLRVGSESTALAVGLGFVWVAGGEEETVLRINPNTFAQVPIRTGGPVSDITVDEDEGVVWVTIS